MGLTAKTCVPCRGGVPALTADEAGAYFGEADGWALSESADRISKRFSFADFARSLAFVNQVGALAEAEGHHPDFSFGWGYCDIVLYTHKIKGLHENDFIMAAKINQLG